MSRETRFYPLRGGLNLAVPSIELPPGNIISGQNYEAHPKGYRRMDGFERLDGRPKPSEASYWVLDFTTGTAAVAEDDVVEGGTSGATGRAVIAGVVESGSYVGGDAAGYLVLTNVSGTFQDLEDLEVLAAKVAEADGAAAERGADTDENDSAWLQASIEKARDDILAVPGSGPVRGVHTFNGVNYAVRNNAGGTAGVLHKSTTSGWTAVSLGREISFDAGTVEFTEGETLTGGTSAATATIERVVLESGTWGESWAEVGNRFPLVASASRFAIAAMSETQIALIDGTNDELKTYSFDGTDWTQVGNALAIATVGLPALAALNSTDVAFIDDTNDSLRTYRFDGTNWALVGAGLAIATVSEPTLAALNGTDVAFFDSGNDELRTYRFDGAAWALVGSALAIATTGPAVASLTALSSTRVAWIDNSNSSLRTYSWSGSAWSLVGSGLTISGAGVSRLAALNSADVAFVSSTNFLRTYRFNETTWEQIGDTLSTIEIGTPTLAALDGTTVTFTDATSDQLMTYQFSLTNTGKGRLILSGVTGAFQDDEALTDGEGGSARADSADTAITLPAGGRYQFINHNFFGSSAMNRMYGCQGEGYGFEFDGTVFVPIHTGMTTDEPIRVAAHRNHLFFAFAGGSLQHSSIGNPYQWQVITGAGELGIGEEITDLFGSVSGALTVFGRNKVLVLQGDDSATWVLNTLSDSSGAVSWTAQTIGQPIYLDDRGLRNLSTTQAFGDFNIGTISQIVESLFRAKTAAGVTAIGSMRVRNKDQYRLFWSDQTGLFVYFGRKRAEITLFDLGVDINVFSSGEDSDGNDVLLMGADDGFVYQMDAGTSFDGSAVTAFIRLPFNHVGSPAQEKRWHKAVFEVDSGPDVSIGVSAEFSYGDPDQPPGQEETFSVAGGGGFWNEAELDNFYWSTPVEGQLEAYLDGIGKNMSLTVASDAIYEAPHIVHGLLVHFSYRRVAR